MGREGDGGRQPSRVAVKYEERREVGGEARNSEDVKGGEAGIGQEGARHSGLFD